MDVFASQNRLRTVVLFFLVGLLIRVVEPGRLSAQTRPIEQSSVAAQPLGEAAPTSLPLPAATQTLPAVPPSTDEEQAVAEVAKDPRSQMMSLRERVQARAEQLDADQERSPESKESLSKLYQQTLLDLQNAEKLQVKLEDWVSRAAAAPGALESLRLQKQTWGDQKPAPRDYGFDWLSFDEAQVKLQQLQAALAVATNQRTSLDTETEFRANRRKELPQLISAAKEKLQQLVAASPAAETNKDPLMSESLQASTEAAKMLATAELQSLESELRAYDAEALLLPLQLEVARLKESELQEQVRGLNASIAKSRASRISDFQRSFSRVNAPPEPPFDHIRRWLAMSEEPQKPDQGMVTWFDLADKQDRIQAEIENAQAELERWQSLRSKMTSRVDGKANQQNVTGFNRWVVERLRKQRSELPDPIELSARLRFFQTEMKLAESMDFDLGDVQTQLRTGKTSSGGSLSDGEMAAFEAGSEIVAAMKVDVDDYLNQLYVLADLKEQTIGLSESYRDFIDRQLLWTPNAERLKMADWEPALAAVRWLLSLENWRSAWGLLNRDFSRDPLVSIAFAVSFIVLIACQSKCRSHLQERSKKAQRSTCTKFSLSLDALLMTFWIALPVPLILLFISWRLHTICEVELTSGFPFALAQALSLAAFSMFPMTFLRQMCRPIGLAVMHFGWQEKQTQSLRRNLRWLIDFSIPLVALIVLLVSQPETGWEESLGRFAFIILMVLLSVFLGFVFDPETGVLSRFVSENRGGWTDRLRYLWYPAIMLGPVVLAALSFIGYHYTSQQLASRLTSTLWMIVTLTVSYNLVKRWIVLNRRSLMMAQARQRLEDAARKDADSAVSLKVAEQDAVNLVAVNEQTKRLVTSLFITAGLVFAWLIWSDVLPAISLLDNVVLWNVKGDLPDELVSITLGNLVLLIPIVVLMIIATRNVPGLLEIALLQHLPLTNAARYAITTLARYVIFALGVVLVASTIGLRWASIQWLVAALGVGLGFGLQEIFGNFISGIILLFEQPIRVGDVVTIDHTTGTVAKIRMRATTIVNWDRQELIVPNKELITGKLINWTLTDTTNRIVLNVGVAYGSDTQRACDIIRQVCDEHPNIMRDPGPMVTFEGFGDNTLNIVLRAFLSSMDKRLSTIHELHGQIYRAFNDAGIEIAFPQRDLHIRSVPESLLSLLGQSPARTHSNASPRPPLHTTDSLKQDTEQPSTSGGG